ncbi:MAG: hypothetical protein ACD_75C01860G0005 [uncultured bacterium]|nr:MAG: hypothetical protein ACD_75C01860G0005 [uncultured bacterium]
MVDIDYVINEKGYIPRGIVLASIGLVVLHSHYFFGDYCRIDPFFPANGLECNVATATIINPVIFKDLCRSVIFCDNLSD